MIQKRSEEEKVIYMTGYIRALEATLPYIKKKHVKAIEDSIQVLRALKIISEEEIHDKEHTETD